jgi:hypothetical protein
MLGIAFVFRGEAGWVRAAGADKMRAAAQRGHLGASTPPVFGTVISVPREQNQNVPGTLVNVPAD